MEQLGINPVLIIAQTVSFVILYLVFKTFLFPKISRALDDRRDAVSASLTGRQEMEKQLVQFKEDQDKQRREEIRKSREMLAAVKKQAQEEKRRIIKAGAQEAARIKERADRRLAAEVEAARKELEGHVRQLASEMAASALKKQAGRDSVRDRVISDNLEELKKTLH